MICNSHRDFKCSFIRKSSSETELRPRTWGRWTSCHTLTKQADGEKLFGANPGLDFPRGPFCLAAGIHGRLQSLLGPRSREPAGSHSSWSLWSRSAVTTVVKPEKEGSERLGALLPWMGICRSPPDTHQCFSLWLLSVAPWAAWTAYSFHHFWFNWYGRWQF